MTAPTYDGDLDRPGRVTPLGPWQALKMIVLRNYLVYRRVWKLFLTGFLEPVFYLLSIGIGVGQLVEGFEFNGEPIEYAAFVAPGMLAASAFNGALLDSTYNVFFKLRYDKLYDQMLATPLTTGDVARGEIVWGQLRGGSYSAAFLVVMLAMGLIDSWWALLALPAALLIGFAFSAVFMSITTFFKSWQDFDKITLVQLPLFLFSATFFPVTAFDGWLRWVVEATPLYRGVVLCRELTTGSVTVASAVSVVYLVAMTGIVKGASQGDGIGEWNAAADPDALAEVLDGPVPLTVVPHEVVPLGPPAGKSAPVVGQIGVLSSMPSPRFWDLATSALFTVPEAGKGVRGTWSVDLDDDLGRLSRTGEGDDTVVTSLDTDRLDAAYAEVFIAE